LEIEKIAKKIGTYEISILPGMCCEIVPKKPSTYSRQEIVFDEEKKVDINELVKEAQNGSWEL
jgi:thiamine biosynthesis protein ThiI